MRAYFNKFMNNLRFFLIYNKYIHLTVAQQEQLTQG